MELFASGRTESAGSPHGVRQFVHLLKIYFQKRCNHYLGNPLMPATPELAQYTTDFGVWVPPDGASVGVEAASLNGKIILCIHNKAPNPGLADILRKTFENEGVAVLEAEDLD